MKLRISGYIAEYGRKKAALMIALVLLLTAATGFTAAYLMAETGPVLNTFISGVDPYGSLTISKAVEHPYGDDYIVPENVKFKFEVSLGDDYAGKTYSGYTADEEGVITLEIPSGLSVTLDEMPADIDVAIKEVDVPDGFKVKGENQRTVKIKKAEDVKEQYINVYSADPVDNNIILKGSKKLEGRKWSESDDYVFVLERYDAEKEEWVSVSEKHATKENKKFDFSEDIQGITFDETGVYSFRISEEEGSIGGVTYDTGISYFDVYVTDKDMDGSLEIYEIRSSSENITITRDEESGVYTVDTEFTNSYAPHGSADIQIDITKELTDTSGQSRLPSGFAFGLYDGDELIAQSEATGATGIISIKKVFEPSDIGEYHWTLKEVVGEDKGITYDDTTYDLAVSVVDKGDGTIAAYVYDYKDRVVSSTASQEFSDSGTGSTSDEDPTSDNDEGNTGKQGSEDDQESADEAADSEEVAVINVPDGAGSTYKASFTNKYRPDSANVNVNGRKVLKGRDIKMGEFSFDLYETDQTHDISGKKPLRTVTNIDANGSFSFDLSLTKVQTYYYTVVENSESKLPGVTYDESKFYVRVDVTDNGGSLSASVSITDQTGKAGDIVFTNIYTPGPCTAVISGTKQLEGKTLQKGQFRFILKQADKDFNTGDTIEEVINDADGGFTFNEISYSSAGTYRYIVTESSEDPLDGVEYDDTVYRVTVEVKDGGEGLLEATQSIEAVRKGSSETVSKITFKNTYTAEYATLNIYATKTLEGGTLKSGMFSFILSESDEDFSEKGETAGTATNDSKGKVVFKDLKFSTEGTYYFILSEDTSAAKSGITYDKSKYGITVTVEDNGKGQLVADIASIEKIGSGSVKSATFVNKTGKSATPGNPGKKSPKTGDNSRLLLWLIAFFASLEGMVITMKMMRKRGRSISD